jgi:hypothetical protein
MLIDQHGAAYYHAAPTQATVKLTQTEDGAKSTY